MSKKFLQVTTVFLLAVWFFFSSSPAYAAACVSNGSGNWTSAATWTSCGGGYPGQTNNNDTATIANGHTVTLNANPTNPIANLTVQSGGTFNGNSSTLTISGSGGAPGLAVAGAFYGQSGTVIFNNSIGATAQTLNVSGVGLIEFYNVTISNVTLNSPGARPINVLGNVSLNNGVFTQGSNRQFIMRGPSTQTFAMSGASTATLGRFRVNQSTHVILPNIGSPQPTAQDVTLNGIMQQTATNVAAFTRFLNLRNAANNADTLLGVDLTPTAALGSTTIIIEGQESLTCTSSGSTSTAYAGRCYFITPTNTNIQTVVTLWALTIKEEVTFPLPAVYRWATPNWVELTNRSSSTVDDYTSASGTTTAFSPFLMADSNNAPTAIQLQGLSSHAGTNLTFVVGTVLLTVLTAFLIWRSRRSMA